MRWEYSRDMKCSRYKEHYDVHIEEILFLFGVYTKQFYILPSGSFQLGDLFLIVSFIYCIIFRLKIKIPFYREDRPFYLYVLMIAIINFVYFSMYKSGFIKGTLYYIYNLLVLLAFTYYTHSERAEEFVKLLGIVLKLIIVSQMVILLTGIGKWYGGVRYLGTFNDPNQYGFFILSTSLLVYLICLKLEKSYWLWLLLGFWLVFPSGSAGMIAGIISFSIIWVISNISDLRRKTVIRVLLLICILIIILIGFTQGFIQLPESVTNSFTYRRVFRRISKFINASSSDIIVSDRGWRRLLEYPQYLFWGAGEGGFFRFNTVLEIHSSVLGPLFYYGFIPFSLICIWVYNKVHGIGLKYLCAYVCLFAESFFLVNTRQPFFWMILAFAGYIKMTNVRNDESKAIPTTY